MKTAAPDQKLKIFLQRQGYASIVGVDEVGRGALAGPVVVAAVMLPPNADLLTIRDSKLLSFSRRELTAREIRASGAQIGIGWIHASHIDEIGLTQALRLAALRSLAHITNYPIRHATPVSRMVILDGKHNYLKEDCQSMAVIKADQTELCVAAASVIAKVARDRWMRQLHVLHPEYGFDRHVGYGTAAHLLALRSYGPSPWHRQSFAPVALSSSLSAGQRGMTVKAGVLGVY